MAVTDYASVRTELNLHTLRSYSSGQVDTFIGLFESRANRSLGPDFRRKASTTINTDSSGEATLPSGTVRIESVTRDVLGSVPLTQVSWNGLVSLNPYEISADAGYYAVRGTTLKVAPVTDDTFNVVHWSKLSGLTSGNTTNWLIEAAPDAYLFGVMAEAAIFEEDPVAAMWEARTNLILDELVAQSNVAEYGNAEVVLDFVTP